ncbi:cold-shock protein [Puniceibacterium antarcticum]|uniref:Cold-shock protein n=1 Tax=Puniceibacterium antarcticum TaxID=1206336 RepID=A0A2G8R0B3_9RHOB|nr:cold shock domain-containing protein [Puniceibacterium antarcticum]PIL14851.1 cold-shock protein [Puniceibacterium antarcticum]
MKQNETETQRVLGKVKWFDPVKGFGFVIPDMGGPDILLHANVLRNFGQGSVADLATIEMGVQATERGFQAVEIYRIEPPAGGSELPLADFEEIDPEIIRSAPLQPARVKWFDKAKGFGFANIFGKPEDVFVHVEVLRRSGLADLEPGEALAIRVIDGKRGAMATEVSAWEAALKIS